jgi:hypothetical protein
MLAENRAQFWRMTDGEGDAEAGEKAGHPGKVFGVAAEEDAVVNLFNKLSSSGLRCSLLHRNQDITFLDHTIHGMRKLRVWWIIAHLQTYLLLYQFHQRGALDAGGIP